MSTVAGPAVACFTVPAAHPALPGHFPGRPIVPGVLLLDAVLRAAGIVQGRILRAKFLAPVRPGDAVEIVLYPRGPGRTGFSGSCRGGLVLTGELACDPAP